MSTPATIECELRAFVTDGQYESLLRRLRTDAVHDGRDEQVTYYFEGNGDPDLRIQRNARGGKIWYKGGKMHEEARKEIEIPFEDEAAFGKFEELFLALGYHVSIKWFRVRETFRLGDVTVTLDDTKGYGKIVEFERLCAEDGREAALDGLREAMAGYGIAPTPKEDFDRRYAEYKADWRSRLGEA
jgi:predicted adenylyl cyclase CyaB